MNRITFGPKTYALDDQGFLAAPGEWDESFAEGMARLLGLSSGLTAKHWAVITFIRQYVAEKKDIPYLHRTCVRLGISLQEMKSLFPSGYHRGACKIAGLSHDFMAAVNLWFTYETTPLRRDKAPTGPLGFLKNASDWTEEFAERTAADHGILGGLTERHWQVIGSIRERFRETGVVPLVYEICERNSLSLHELMVLFPRGYHRGACRIAGLNPRV